MEQNPNCFGKLDKNLPYCECKKIYEGVFAEEVVQRLLNTKLIIPKICEK